MSYSRSLRHENPVQHLSVVVVVKSELSLRKFVNFCAVFDETVPMDGKGPRKDLRYEKSKLCRVSHGKTVGGKLRHGAVLAAAIEFCVTPRAVMRYRVKAKNTTECVSVVNSVTKQYAGR